jgi:hypothetical protein
MGRLMWRCLPIDIPILASMLAFSSPLSKEDYYLDVLAVRNTQFPPRELPPPRLVLSRNSQDERQGHLLGSAKISRMTPQRIFRS